LAEFKSVREEGVRPFVRFWLVSERPQAQQQLRLSAQVGTFHVGQSLHGDRQHLEKDKFGLNALEE
jgi:hypothetical protein